MIDVTGLTASLLASGAPEDVRVVTGLESAWSGAVAIGSAFPVRGSRRDNLAIHLAIAEAAPGDVIVADVGGETDVAHLGDIVAAAARRRGIRGIVVDGSIRDRAGIAAVGLPVFHRGTSPRGPAKSVAGDRNVTIAFMGVGVSPGDLICVDDDGLVVVPASKAATAVRGAQAVAEREQVIMERVAAGASTLDIFNLTAPAT